MTFGKQKRVPYMGAIHGYCRRAFTLVELLMATGIAALIMGLGIPAFSRMTRGHQLENCAKNIKLGIEQAQMRAASERRYVAVIFPNGPDANVSPSIRQYRLGGFRLAYVRKDSDNGGFSFVGWLAPGWNNAPTGAGIAKITANETLIKETIDGCYDSTFSAMVDENDNPCLQSVTGIKDEAGQDLHAGSNNALILTPYGNTVGTSKLYLVISEMSHNGDAIVYPSTGKNDETDSYLVLKVNNLTGRVEYYSNETNTGSE